MATRKRTSINDFRFKKTGYGFYDVTYTSPVTDTIWVTTISDMSLIDATLCTAKPRQQDLDQLKKICKGYGRKKSRTEY